MRFSNRIPASLAPNAWSTTLARLRAERPGSLLDLTVSNPTVAGLPYSTELIAALNDSRALRYDPQPLGQWEARAAVAAEYRRHGRRAAPENVVLTTSTSEAYSFLFRVFCDPGEEVLVPSPSYPLFEHLARLDGVELLQYPLEYSGVWSIDRAALVERMGDRTRAVVTVAPNNPTGSFLRTADWDFLRQECGRRDIPIICDEVFVDYALEPAEDAVRSVLGELRGTGEDPLVISLGGLSKSIGLPQHKLGWLVLDGSDAQVAVAREKLEWICDSYLSVQTAIQVALPTLLAAGASLRSAIGKRLTHNLRLLETRVQKSPACEVLRVEGGWSAVLRVPSTDGEEALVMDLLERDHVVAHPGFFFDFASEAFLVISLLTASDVFEEGIDRLCRRVADHISCPKGN